MWRQRFCVCFGVKRACARITVYNLTLKARHFAEGIKQSCKNLFVNFGLNPFNDTQRWNLAMLNDGAKDGESFSAHI